MCVGWEQMNHSFFVMSLHGMDSNSTPSNSCSLCNLILNPVSFSRISSFTYTISFVWISFPFSFFLSEWRISVCLFFWFWYTCSMFMEKRVSVWLNTIRLVLPRLSSGARMVCCCYLCSSFLQIPLKKWDSIWLKSVAKNTLNFWANRFLRVSVSFWKGDNWKLIPLALRKTMFVCGKITVDFFCSFLH